MKIYLRKFPGTPDHKCNDSPAYLVINESVHVSIRWMDSSFPSFSLKLRTRPVKIVCAQVRHLKNLIRSPLFEDSHDRIRQS